MLFTNITAAAAATGRVHMFRLHSSDMLSAKLQAEHPFLRAYTATEVGGLMQADITVSHAGSLCSNFTRAMI